MVRKLSASALVLTAAAVGYAVQQGWESGIV